ncbi:hypothetical protein OG21DRAFT_1528150, partial [Imleria badia]
MSYSGQADLLRGNWTSDISLANSIDLSRNNTSSTYLYMGGPSNSLLAHAAQSAKQQITANLGSSHVVAICPVRGGEVSIGGQRQGFIQYIQTVPPHVAAHRRQVARGFPKLLSSSRLRQVLRLVIMFEDLNQDDRALFLQHAKFPNSELRRSMIKKVITVALVAIFGP